MRKPESPAFAVSVIALVNPAGMVFCTLASGDPHEIGKYLESSCRAPEQVESLLLEPMVEEGNFQTGKNASRRVTPMLFGFIFGGMVFPDEERFLAAANRTWINDPVFSRVIFSYPVPEKLWFCRESIDLGTFAPVPLDYALANPRGTVFPVEDWENGTVPAEVVAHMSEPGGNYCLCVQMKNKTVFARPGDVPKETGSGIPANHQPDLFFRKGGKPWK